MNSMTRLFGHAGSDAFRVLFVVSVVLLVVSLLPGNMIPDGLEPITPLARLVFLGGLVVGGIRGR